MPMRARSDRDPRSWFTNRDSRPRMSASNLGSPGWTGPHRSRFRYRTVDSRRSSGRRRIDDDADPCTSPPADAGTRPTPKDKTTAMKRMHAFMFCLSLTLGPLLSATGQQDEAAWPHWRGPDGTGAADGNPPIEWSEEENIRWKVETPGKGSSTPIVWKDWIIITTAIDTGVVAPESERPEPPPQRQRPGGAGGRGEGGQRGGRGRGGRRGGRGRRNREPPKNYFEYAVIAMDRKTGKTVWTSKVEKNRSPRTWPRHQQPGLGFTDDGRQAHLRLLRFSRGLLPGHEGQGPMEEGSRDHADPKSIRRRWHTVASRRHADRHLGPRG